MDPTLSTTLIAFTLLSDGKEHAGKVLQHSQTGGYEFLACFGFRFHLCLQRLGCFATCGTVGTNTLETSSALDIGATQDFQATFCLRHFIHFSCDSSPLHNVCTSPAPGLKPGEQQRVQRICNRRVSSSHLVSKVHRGVTSTLWNTMYCACTVAFSEACAA